MSAPQAKRLIEAPFDVAKSRLVRQAIVREETQGLFFVSQMNKRKPRPSALDFFTLLSQLGDRLAAKRSTKVAEKNQQNRQFGREDSQWLTGLRAIGI